MYSLSRTYVSLSFNFLFAQLVKISSCRHNLALPWYLRGNQLDPGSLSDASVNLFLGCGSGMGLEEGPEAGRGYLKVLLVLH